MVWQVLAFGSQGVWPMSSTKPKKAPTGYTVFLQAKRPEAAAELAAELGEGAKPKPTDVVRRIAAKWKELTKDEQAERYF